MRIPLQIHGSGPVTLVFDPPKLASTGPRWATYKLRIHFLRIRRRDRFLGALLTTYVIVKAVTS